jgi:predicted ATPase
VEHAGAVVHLRPAQRRVLAILCLEAEGAVDRDTLLDRMWGDRLPPTGPSALQVHLTGIRKAAPGLIVNSGTAYRVDLARYGLDLVSFEEHAARAATERRAGRWDRALRAADHALTVWRGPPFEDLRQNVFAAAPIARMEAIHDDLVDVRGRALLELGRVTEAVIALREEVRRQPFREPLWEQLMLALHRAGRQAEALRAYQEARTIFAAELGVEPGPGLRRMEERIAFGDETLGEAAPTASPTNLPLSLTSFVGREDDLRQVADLLASGQLVTAVGGPGIGKTRLAIEAGHGALAGHPDGVWFASVTDARGPTDVVGVVAEAIGLRSQTASIAELADRLVPRRALLILDNCEHVIDACADLARALVAKPGRVRVLATSRRPLGVEGEAVWRIPPLPAPPAAEAVDAAAALRSPAVRLFLDRARAADRTYRLTATNAPLVAALCRRADGIPLALELAAAWVPGLGLADIEAMLSSDLAPRVGERDRREQHRSLHAALEWSIALLAPEDRELFYATSVFRGTFGLEDVLGVCVARGERRRTAAAVGRLVDASLLVVDRRDDGRVFYRTLVPIRDFARDRLEQQPAWSQIRDRFVTHYLDRARAAAPDLIRSVVDLRAVDDDIDNLREAFELGIATGRATEVARGMVPLDGYFLNRYLSLEQRTWLTRLLPLIGDPEVRAHALLSAGLAAQATNALDEAVGLMCDAVDAFERLHDASGTVRALLALAGLRTNRGEAERAIATALRARRMLGASGNPSARGVAAIYIGKSQGDLGRASIGLRELERAARHFLRAGELGRASQALSSAAYLALTTGHEAVARRLADEAVVLGQRSDSGVRLVRALSASAAVEAAWGDPALAARRFAEVDERLVSPANEELFELLLPAGFLVHRWGCWELLRDIVRSVEAVIATSSQGYPGPWRTTAAAWLLEAEAAMARARSPLSEGIPTTGEVRRELRRQLEARTRPE